MAEAKAVAKKNPAKDQVVAKKQARDKKLKNADSLVELGEDVAEINDQILPAPTSSSDKKEAILDKEPAVKKKEAGKEEKWGILHIYSSYNNTHLHITDVTGTETIAKVTGGMVTKSDRLKATPNVAMAAAKQLSETCHSAGITSLYVKLRAVGGHNGPMTPGPGAQAAIRMLTRYGVKLGRIEDVTPVPHDKCRPKGGKRGRRV